MALKFLGAAVLTLGLLIIAVQITAWVLLSDFVDKVGSGLWGGAVIAAAGILAVLRKPSFRAVAVLAILGAGAVAALYTWSLIRVMNERGILAPSRALDWIELWGRMGDCSHMCKMKIGLCPVMILLAILVLIFTSGLLFAQVKSQLPWRQRPPKTLDPKEELGSGQQTPPAASSAKEQQRELRSSPKAAPRSILSTLI